MGWQMNVGSVKVRKETVMANLCSRNICLEKRRKIAESEAGKRAFRRVLPGYHSTVLPVHQTAGSRQALLTGFGNTVYAL
jgi:hypothetical protein